MIAIKIAEKSPVEPIHDNGRFVIAAYPSPSTVIGVTKKKDIKDKTPAAKPLHSSLEA